MTARVARPLPECSECGDPVRRPTHLANGGRCTDCALRVQFSQPTQLELAGLEPVED